MTKQTKTAIAPLVVKTLLINLVVGIGLALGMVLLLGAIGITNPALNTTETPFQQTMILVSSCIAFYAAYRIAFWSLAPLKLKAKVHALCTPLAVFLVQNLIGGWIGAQIGRLAHLGATAPANAVGPKPNVAVVILAIALCYTILGGFMYMFALRRANRKFEGFDATAQSAPHISKKVRPFMLAYGCIATLTGIGTIITGVYSIITKQAYAEAINVVSWPVFLVLFWAAYKSYVIGQRAFWRIFAPLLVIADVLGIFYYGRTMPTSETIISLVLSTPLYLTVLWYAYIFLPASRSREIKHLSREKLFK